MKFCETFTKIMLSKFCLKFKAYTFLVVSS